MTSENTVYFGTVVGVLTHLTWRYVVTREDGERWDLAIPPGRKDVIAAADENIGRLVYASGTLQKRLGRLVIDMHDVGGIMNAEYQKPRIVE